MKGVIIQAAATGLLVAAGIAVGWFAADAGKAPAEDEKGAAAATPALSPQALANLGVTIEKVTLSDFVQTVRVQATVIDAPLNTRPVTTALGGVVTELHVRPGQFTGPGQPLVTLVRSDIARPELALTGALLPSLSEDFHTAVAAYRNATTGVAIVRSELLRVKAFTETGTDGGLPVLPRQTQIDLEYDLKRAEQQLTNARREIERHGLTGEEIDRIETAHETVGNDRLWRNALAANGFWGPNEDAVLAALPESLRSVAWVVGGLGELAAAGRSGPALARAVAAEPRLQPRFVEALCLLLNGNSVERVQLLAASGELDPVVVVRAPAGPTMWDVEDVLVRPGEQLAAGSALATLHDARTMWMRVEPIGDEVAAVTSAHATLTEITARPLLAGAGPELSGLHIDRIGTRGGEHERGARAFVVCQNELLRETADATAISRTWKLREGLQYVIHVPAKTLEKRIVLPASAVIEQGVERVVLVKDGDAFRAQPVHVEFEDEAVAVIANDGALFAGDPVVVTGAFALGLSMGGSAGADPHAGHNHD